MTATVSGRVQGVGFRWSTGQMAQSLHLVGLAQNLPDGNVRVIAEGEALISPRITRRLIEEFSRLNGPRAVDEETIKQLTDREREVLELIARGLSNTEIAAELYVSQATVKTHIGRLLMKLDARDRAQLVVAAYEAGVVQPGS